MLTLREIRGSDTGTVPGLSMLLSYVLMLASIVVLILFVHHAGQGLRVAGLIDLVGDRAASSSSASTETARRHRRPGRDRRRSSPAT